MSKAKQFVLALKEKGCKLCGEKGPPRSIHFHHTDPEGIIDPSMKKEYNISQLVNGSAKFLGSRLELLIKELQKGIFLCANCHAKAHESKLDDEIIMDYSETSVARWVKDTTISCPEDIAQLYIDITSMGTDTDLMEEQKAIQAMLFCGMSIREIAHVLGYASSTLQDKMHKLQFIKMRSDRSVVLRKVKEIIEPEKSVEPEKKRGTNKKVKLSIKEMCKQFKIVIPDKEII